MLQLITLMVRTILSSLIPNSFLCWSVQYMYAEGLCCTEFVLPPWTLKLHWGYKWHPSTGGVQVISWSLSLVSYIGGLNGDRTANSQAIIIAHQKTLKHMGNIEFLLKQYMAVRRLPMMLMLLSFSWILGQLQLGYISLLWEADPSCLLLVKNLKS
jgi:hypothetical protein